MPLKFVSLEVLHRMEIAPLSHKAGDISYERNRAVVIVMANQQHSKHRCGIENYSISRSVSLIVLLLKKSAPRARGHPVMLNPYRFDIGSFVELLY